MTHQYVSASKKINLHPCPICHCQEKPEWTNQQWMVVQWDHLQDKIPPKQNRKTEPELEQDKAKGRSRPHETQRDKGVS